MKDKMGILIRSGIYGTGWAFIIVSIMTYVILAVNNKLKSDTMPEKLVDIIVLIICFIVPGVIMVILGGKRSEPMAASGQMDYGIGQDHMGSQTTQTNQTTQTTTTASSFSRVTQNGKTVYQSSGTNLDPDQTADFVKDMLQSMSGMFGNMQTGGQTKRAPRQKSVKCKNCGADVAATEGTSSKCEFCGSLYEWREDD